MDSHNQDPTSETYLSNMDFLDGLHHGFPQPTGTDTVGDVGGGSDVARQVRRTHTS